MRFAVFIELPPLLNHTMLCSIQYTSTYYYKYSNLISKNEIKFKIPAIWQGLYTIYFLLSTNYYTVISNFLGGGMSQSILRFTSHSSFISLIGRVNCG